MRAPVGSLLFNLVLPFVVGLANSQYNGLVGGSTADKNDVDSINVVKVCNDYGTTVGTLELRVWRESDELVSICDLHKATPRMGYTISWTLGKDLGSRKTMSFCDFSQHLPSRNSSVSCEYRLKLPRFEDGEKIACWVKSYNEWSSESMTCCASDEITLSSRSYMRWRDKDRRLAPLLAALGYGQKTPLDVDEAGLRRQASYPSRHFDQYVVEVAEYQAVEVCQWRNSWRVLRVDIRPRLDFVPHSITWNCSVSMGRFNEGNYSLLMMKGNASDLFFSFGAYLKRCDRTQDNMTKALNCEITMPITNEDIGRQKYICQYYQGNETKPVCMSESIMYNITTLTMFKEKLDQIQVEQEQEEEESIREREFVSKYRLERPRGSNRTSLPWVTRPLEGPGVRLNGHQYMIMGVGSATFFLAGACLVNMVRTAFRKRRQNELAVPCYCGEKVEDEESSESRSDKSKKKGKKGAKKAKLTKASEPTTAAKPRK